MNMIDAILYIQNFPALVIYLAEHTPDYLERDEKGDIAQPPIVTGLARTSAATRNDGQSLGVYVRMTDEQAEQWRGTPGVEILAEAPYKGVGTGDTVYQQIWDDPDKLAKYDSVYDRTPVEIDDGEGGTYTYTPPAKFGIIAGA